MVLKYHDTAMHQYIVPSLLTADEFVAIRLHSKINYISEAPSLENHNIQTSLSHHNYLILHDIYSFNNSFHTSQFHASVNHVLALLITWKTINTHISHALHNACKYPAAIQKRRG